MRKLKCIDCGKTIINNDYSVSYTKQGEKLCFCDVDCKIKYNRSNYKDWLKSENIKENIQLKIKGREFFIHILLKFMTFILFWIFLTSLILGVDYLVIT